VCPACGQSTRAPLPEEARKQLGAQLTALIAYAFVNSIWPTSILSFGPPCEPMISLAPGEAEPCAAIFAAR
jgi:hypothetical protein